MGQAIADWCRRPSLAAPVVIFDDLPDEEVFSAQHHRSDLGHSFSMELQRLYSRLMNWFRFSSYRPGTNKQ